MAQAENQRPDQAPGLNTTRARQGSRGRHALWVLVISLGLIGVIYAVMVLGMQGTHASQPGGQTTVDRSTLQQAGGFQAPTPQARQTEQSPTVSPSIAPSAGKEQTPTSKQ